MGVAGRPKKSLDEIAPGSYRRSRHGPLPPEPGGPPPKPKGLGRVGGKLWELVVRTRPAVREAHGPALFLLCLWWQKAVGGLTAKKKVAPNQVAGLTTAAAIATDKWLAIAAKFGLTPLDQTRLRKADPGAEVPKQPKVETRPKTQLDMAGPPETT